MSNVTVSKDLLDIEDFEDEYNSDINDFCAELLPFAQDLVASQYRLDSYNNIFLDDIDEEESV